MQVGRENQFSLAGITDATEQNHSIASELVEIQAVTAVLARDLRMVSKPVPRRFQFFDLSIEETYAGKPIVDVLAAKASRDTSGTADGELDFSSTLIKLFGNLGAGLSGANHKNDSGGKRRGVLVVHGVNLQNFFREMFVELWDFWGLV